MFSDWELIKFAEDCVSCLDCGEPWCETHGLHYSDCECLGPTQDGVEYKSTPDGLFGRRKGDGDERRE